MLYVTAGFDLGERLNLLHVCSVLDPNLGVNSCVDRLFSTVTAQECPRSALFGDR